MKALLSSIISLANLFLNIFAAYFLYGCFLMPLGLPSITYFHMAGILLTIGFLKFTYTQEKRSKKTLDEQIHEALERAMTISIIIGVAVLYTLGM
jgi:hypothetical protein